MDWVDPLRVSLLVSSVGALACIAAGTPIAWGIARSGRGPSMVLSALALVPLVLPPTAIGYYLLWLMGRESPIGRFLIDDLGLRLVFTWPGAAIAAAIVALPLYVRTAVAGFQQLDEETLRVARTLSGPSRVFFAVALPMAWPALAAATLIAFARCLGEFGATVVVAGNIPGETRTLPAAIYDAALAGNRQQANELALVSLLVGFVILAALTVAIQAALHARRRA